MRWRRGEDSMKSEEGGGREGGWREENERVLKRDTYRSGFLATDDSSPPATVSILFTEGFRSSPVT